MLLILMLMLMFVSQAVFTCAYANACAHALVRTSLNEWKHRHGQEWGGASLPFTTRAWQGLGVYHTLK